MLKTVNASIEACDMHMLFMQPVDVSIVCANRRQG